MFQQLQNAAAETSVFINNKKKLLFIFGYDLEFN